MRMEWRGIVSEGAIMVEPTLAASEPYSESVFVITACRSTIPQLWSVFATASAPTSSTSEKISLSMMMGLGPIVVE